MLAGGIREWRLLLRRFAVGGRDAAAFFPEAAAVRKRMVIWTPHRSGRFDRRDRMA
jgi:hypothetical protein